MKKFNIKDFIKGWFVGNFSPTIINTNDVEVAIKFYKEGDHEDSHYHKVAAEITAIVFGEVEMNNIVYVAGDIVVIEPGERTDFTCLNDAVTVVVKYPGASNDKYLD